MEHGGAGFLLQQSHASAVQCSVRPLGLYVLTSNEKWYFRQKMEINICIFQYNIPIFYYVQGISKKGWSWFKALNGLKSKSGRKPPLKFKFTYWEGFYIFCIFCFCIQPVYNNTTPYTYTMLVRGIFALLAEIYIFLFETI